MKIHNKLDRSMSSLPIYEAVTQSKLNEIIMDTSMKKLRSIWL